jgi:hypothetical protein
VIGDQVLPVASKRAILLLKGMLLESQFVLSFQSPGVPDPVHFTAKTLDITKRQKGASVKRMVIPFNKFSWDIN